MAVRLEQRAVTRAPNFRQRVKRLKVWHSPNDRKITWWCFDLLP